jgi:hypothetical protein
MVDITRHVITWSISGNPTIGQFVNGDYYVVDSGSGVTITGRTPAPEGSGTTARNGGMINPKHEVTPLNSSGTRKIYHHGYDGRLSNGLTYSAGTRTFSNIFQYRDQDNAELLTNFPITLYAGDSLVSMVSYSPTTDPVATQAFACSYMSVLTILGSDPGNNTAFRPPYYGDNKPLHLLSSVDFNKLPGLTPPASPADPFAGNYALFGDGYPNDPQLERRRSFEYLQYQIHAETVQGLQSIRPLEQMDTYPSYNADLMSQAIAYMLCSWGVGQGPGVQTIAKRFMQIGIDNYEIVSDYAPALYGGAGFGMGFYWPIIFAGFMLNDEGMMNVKDLTSAEIVDYHADRGNPSRVFQEWTNTGHSTTPYPVYRLPRPRSSYPNGIPLYGDIRETPGPSSNHSTYDPAKEFDGGITRTGANPYPYETTHGGNTWNANGGDYDAIATTPGIMQVLAARRMGFAHLYKQSYLDWIDRWANDPGMWANYITTTRNYYQGVDVTYRGDIYGFSGTGNDFCRQMWLTHRYPGGRKCIVF